MSQQLAQALLGFLNTISSEPLETLREVVDKPALLPDLLIQIDGNWFQPLSSSANKDTTSASSENWVIKLNNLKKIHKLILAFFENNLGLSILHLDQPNLSAIAKDPENIIDIIKLFKLILVLCVQCEGNQQYIEKIQLLPPFSQHTLMLSIEEIMQQLQNSAPLPSTPMKNGVVDQRLLMEKDELENANKVLAAKLEEMTVLRDSLLEDKTRFADKIEELERTLSQMDGVNKADFVLKSEIENLKKELERSENRRIDYEYTLETQQKAIDELQLKVTESAKHAEEAKRWKDEVDVLKHVSDKFSKSEAMIEKYKRKIEEFGDMKKQMKSLEDQNAQLHEKNNALEEEYRKVSAFKPIMDTYKETIARLETEKSDAMKENVKLKVDVQDLTTKLTQVESNRQHDHDQIAELEERLREIELGGDHDGKRVHGEVLADTMDDDVTTLRSKVVELESEVQRLKSLKSTGKSSTSFSIPGLDAVSSDADKIMVLEHLLEDEKRKAQRFEQDYLKEHQEKLFMESELKQLKEKNVGGSGNEVIAQVLRAKVQEYESQVSQLNKRLAESDVKLQQARNEIDVLQGDLAMLMKPVSTQPNDEEYQVMMDRYEQIMNKNHKLEEEHQFQMAQLDKLLAENASKERANAELKNALQEALRERQASRQGSHGDDPKLKETLSRCGELEEQCIQLHVALKKAKEHILAQDKALKDRGISSTSNTAHSSDKPTSPTNNSNYEETINTLKTLNAQKDMELTRIRQEFSEWKSQVKKEQKLISSAWYSMGMEILKGNVGLSTASSGAPAGSISSHQASTPNRSTTTLTGSNFAPATPNIMNTTPLKTTFASGSNTPMLSPGFQISSSPMNSPGSWLTMQRKNLNMDGQFVGSGRRQR